jgi:hypothetical protein
MFDLLSSIFDADNEEFDSGCAAGRDAGLLEDVLYDVLPFGTEAFEAGYEQGRADRDS